MIALVSASSLRIYLLRDHVSDGWYLCLEHPLHREHDDVLDGKIRLEDLSDDVLEAHRPCSSLPFMLERVELREDFNLPMRVIHLVVVVEHDHDTSVGLVLVRKSHDACQLGTTDDVDDRGVEGVVQLHCLPSNALERGDLDGTITI